jgi:hypothetical protein
MLSKLKKKEDKRNHVSFGKVHFSYFRARSPFCFSHYYSIPVFHTNKHFNGNFQFSVDPITLFMPLNFKLYLVKNVYFLKSAFFTYSKDLTSYKFIYSFLHVNLNTLCTFMLRSLIFLMCW